MLKLVGLLWGWYHEDQVRVLEAIDLHGVIDHLTDKKQLDLHWDGAGSEEAGIASDYVVGLDLDHGPLFTGIKFKTIYYLLIR